MQNEFTSALCTMTHEQFIPRWEVDDKSHTIMCSTISTENTFLQDFLVILKRYIHSDMFNNLQSHTNVLSVAKELNPQTSIGVLPIAVMFSFVSHCSKRLSLFSDFTCSCDK